MSRLISLLIVACLYLPTPAEAASPEDIAANLQRCCVTIKKGHNDRGSGAIITRPVEGQAVNFVLTAHHVVEDLRQTKTVIAKDGTERKDVKYKDASILQEWIDSKTGERVG